MWTVWMKYLLLLFSSTIDTISFIKLPRFFLSAILFHSFTSFSAKSFRTYLKFGDNVSLKLIMKIGVLLKCSMILSFSSACVFFSSFSRFHRFCDLLFQFSKTHTHTKHWLVGLCASEFSKSFLLVWGWLCYPPMEFALMHIWSSALEQVWMGKPAAR